MNTQAFCTSAKVKALAALVASGDTLMAALYLSSASLDETTAAYTTSGEAVGAGYAAGGIPVTHAVDAGADGTAAVWTPSAAIVFATVTLIDFDTMLLYNASDSDSAVAVYTFGSQGIISGTFTLTMPTNDAANALLRIA